MTVGVGSVLVLVFAELMLLLFVAGVGSVNFCVVVCSGVCRVNVSVGSFNVVVVSLLVLA